MDAAYSVILLKKGLSKRKLTESSLFINEEELKIVTVDTRYFRVSP